MHKLLAYAGGYSCTYVRTYTRACAKYTLFLFCRALGSTRDINNSGSEYLFQASGLPTPSGYQVRYSASASRFAPPRSPGGCLGTWRAQVVPDRFPLVTLVVPFFFIFFFVYSGLDSVRSVEVGSEYVFHVILTLFAVSFGTYE